MQTEAVTIQLTAEDVQDCTDFAKELERTCFENGYKQKYGQFSKEQKFKHSLQGYLGERAVGKYFNYETVYTPYNLTIPDVLGYEVRTVKYANAILITHPDDTKYFIADYICVSLNHATMLATLKGWSGIKRCNVPSFWINRINWHTACYGMHESLLYDIETLPATKELIAHQSLTRTL